MLSIVCTLLLGASVIAADHAAGHKQSTRLLKEVYATERKNGREHTETDFSNDRTAPPKGVQTQEVGGARIEEAVTSKRRVTGQVMEKKQEEKQEEKQEGKKDEEHVLRRQSHQREESRAKSWRRS